MSNSNTTLEFAQGQLVDIASSYGQPYMPDASISFIDGTSKQVSPALKTGKLWFALKEDDAAETLTVGNNSVSLGRHRAYIFLDDDSNRYAVTGPVNWDEIYNKPEVITKIDFIDGVNETYKTLQGYNENAAIENAKVTLPFLYANKADTLTAPLTLSGGDSTTSGKIILNPKNGSQFTDNGTSTLFGFVGNQESTKNLTVGHTSYNLHLRTSTQDRWSDENDKKNGPKITVNGTKVIAYLDDIMPKAKCDSVGNQINDTYFYSSRLNNTDPHTLEFFASSNKQVNSINLPFVCLTGDTMTGPLSIAQDNSAAGILKKVTLDYNEQTESLDFSFT